MQECTGRIPKDRQAGRLGNDLNEELRLLGSNVRACIEGYPSDVCSGMREAFDETLSYWIACIRKHNRDRYGGIFGRQGGRRGGGDDYIDLETDQFPSRFLEPVKIPHRKPAFNDDVLSLNPTKISQTSNEGVIR